MARIYRIAFPRPSATFAQRHNRPCVETNTRNDQVRKAQSERNPGGGSQLVRLLER